MTLVPGMDVELRLSVQRDDEGESTGFRGETMVAQHEGLSSSLSSEHSSHSEISSSPTDLRLHVKRGSGSQLFPATVDDRDEAETVDLTGDPFRYNPDGTILRQLVRSTVSLARVHADIAVAARQLAERPSPPRHSPERCPAQSSTSHHFSHPLHLRADEPEFG